jgi:SAM-dependent methyltransferases related to tRNA (uracil-5-)-methyltransferase
VSQMSPSRIVYVSCDPATLARDLARFDSLGWGCVSGTVVDMFPKTANMETVVLLSKLKEDYAT